jgi:protocatechuate 3,4-dioxygenase beta subunit
MKQMDRRQALATIGSTLLVGCISSNNASSDAGSQPDAASSGNTCGETPEETAGPYPDTTNMVGDASTYRSDVREDRQGVPLTVMLTVVDVAAGCAPVPGAHVEIWHCDADGVYSEYGAGVGATFLRGVQTTDASGKVTFTTIYPGWYQGRATHIHIQVYDGTTVTKTTQLAFPEEVNQVVYGGGSPYYTKGQNPTSNASDMVFSDGDTLELAATSGTIASGYTALLQVGV